MINLKSEKIKVLCGAAGESRAAQRARKFHAKVKDSPVVQQPTDKITKGIQWVSGNHVEAISTFTSVESIVGGCVTVGAGVFLMTHAHVVAGVGVVTWACATAAAPVYVSYKASEDKVKDLIQEARA